MQMTFPLFSLRVGKVFNIIHQVLRKGTYWLKDWDIEIIAKPINDKYLKKYVPSTWEHEQLRHTTEVRQH